MMFSAGQGRCMPLQSTCSKGERVSSSNCRAKVSADACYKIWRGTAIFRWLSVKPLRDLRFRDVAC